MVDDVSLKSVSRTSLSLDIAKLLRLTDRILVIGMTKRMLEEKDQLNQQRNRTEQLRQFIDMSMNLKNET